MLNDLLWKLLGKIGVEKERTIHIGKPSVPLNEPITEDYKVPKVTPMVQYQPPQSPSPVQQYQSPQGRLRQQPPEPVLGAVSQASSKFGVPEELLLDLAFSESSYNPKSTNEIGAKGLYQFTPQTWQDVLSYSNNPEMSLYGELPNEDPLDPLTNALAAAYLIKMGQLGKWDASEWNWGQNYSPQELEDLGFYKQSTYHKPGLRPSVRLGGNE